MSELNVTSQVLSIAWALDLPGTSELYKIVSEGDVILLKASSIINSPEVSDDVESPLWDRTERECNMGDLWHAKMHLALYHLDPKVLEDISDIIRNSQHPLIIEERKDIMETHGFEIGTESNAFETIVSIICLFRYPELVRSLIEELFPLVSVSDSST